MEDLLVIPFVRRWATGDGFTRFSASRHKKYPPYLMAEFDDGKFWVVGYLDADPQWLPEWDKAMATRYRKQTGHPEG